MNPTVSPADSLLSAPSDSFEPLFHIDSTVVPADTSIAMTPQSFDNQYSRDSSEAPSMAVDTDKKPTKKRKSWGQELPTPKTNLPPRKRAKTEDEKEQRRIERVLRNRAAAHSSRERKRKEVEGLESEKHGVERENIMLKSQNEKLAEQVARLSAEMAVFRSMMSQSLPLSADTKTSPILSAPASQSNPLEVKQELDDLSFSFTAPQATVDPRESSFSSPADSPSALPDLASTASDMTQHPAEMLCDLQCQSEAMEVSLESMASLNLVEEQRRQAAYLLTLSTVTHLLFLTMVSTTYSRLMAPLSQILRSLKTGTALPPNFLAPTQPSQQPWTNTFPLILWLISTPRTLWTAATASSTSETQMSLSQPQPFRLPLLKRLLACSPTLARPLRVATGQALQLTSSSVAEARTAGRIDSGAEANVASLMTMLRALDSIEREKRAKSRRKRGGLKKTSGTSRGAHIVSSRNDPVGDVKRLCEILDGFFENRGRDAKSMGVVGVERRLPSGSSSKEKWA